MFFSFFKVQTKKVERTNESLSQPSLRDNLALVRGDDARDELDERVCGGVVFAPRVVLVPVLVLVAARARPSRRFFGARGTTARARVRNGRRARPRASTGRPRAPPRASRDSHGDERRRRER
jgi:hypothetical protein